jgi:hypothetical protein
VHSCDQQVAVRSAPNAPVLGVAGALIRRGLSFESRHAPFERGQFLYCAYGRLKQEVRLLQRWRSVHTSFFREFVKLRRDVV